MLKFTMLFNFQGSGFSESWYYLGAAPAAGADLLSGDFQALAQQRNLMCASGVNLVGARLSDTANPRQTRVQILLAPTGGTAAPDVATNSWLAMVRGVNNAGRRQLFFRGLPDDEIVWDAVAQKFLPQGGLAKAFNAYKKLLINAPWALRVVQPKASSTTVQNIAGITPNSLYGGVELTGPVPPAPNTNLIVSGFRKPLGNLNGTYDGISGWTQTAGGNIVLLKRPLSSFEAAGYPGGAVIRNQVFTGVRIEDLQLEFPRERRIGRAFFVARGRRSAR